MGHEIDFHGWKSSDAHAVQGVQNIYTEIDMTQRS